MLNKGIITNNKGICFSTAAPALVLPWRRDKSTLTCQQQFHSFIHSLSTRAGGETQSPANRLPFRQDKGKHQADEEGRVASRMYLLAPAMVAC